MATRSKAPSIDVILRNEIVNSMNTFLNYSGKNREDYFKLLGMSPPTYYRRLKNPMEFSINELKKIAALAGMDFLSFLNKVFDDNMRIKI